MSADFNSTTHPVNTRALRRCEECGRQIEVGETYERTVGKWCGQFFTNIACQHCGAARRIANDKSGYGEEDYYGGLSEYLREADTTWEYRLAAGLTHRWRYQSGALMPVPTTEEATTTA